MFRVVQRTKYFNFNFNALFVNRTAIKSILFYNTIYIEHMYYSMLFYLCTNTIINNNISFLKLCCYLQRDSLASHDPIHSEENGDGFLSTLK